MFNNILLTDHLLELLIKGKSECHIHIWYSFA